jgi:hypothetical protein
MKRLLAALSLLLISTAALAAPDANRTIKLVQKFSDQKSLSNQLRARGYKARGGIDRAITDFDDGHQRAFPHFSSSFSVGGQKFPFTMVGYPPRSGRTATFTSIIIPLRMHFLFFGADGSVSNTFEPGPAVKSLTGSPMYNNARWPGGLQGQFVDAMQRATFWNKMDAGHDWHVVMDAPVVGPTVDIEVTPETGALGQLPDGTFLGDVLIDFMDAQINTIVQLLGIGPDVLPIFVTDMVTAEALGYHSAGVVSQPDGTRNLQTYLYTSWLDPAEVDPLFADVSTFNHELAEWANDPYVNNLTPDWNYPPASDPRTQCSGNPFLEVGDPQGNGPTFDDFPTVVVRVHGVDYHLQQLVMLPWFADEVPSSALNGWYTFPDPSSLSSPAVYCQ